MMTTNKRTKNPHAGGAVDFDAVQPTVEPHRFGYWRVLRNRKTGETFKLFGYNAGDVVSGKGPWVGYTEETIKQAPCEHCGRAGHMDRLHVCPGFYLPGPTGDPGPPVCNYEGMKANNGEHVCCGRPSMAYHGVSRFSGDEWSELVVNRLTPARK